MIWELLGFPLGLLYCNAGEWFIHKYVLHRLGKSKNSLWSFHWHEHHRLTLKNDFYDPGYKRKLFGWHAQSKEALGLLLLALIHMPAFVFAPFFAGAVMFSLCNYYWMHKKAHRDFEWAKTHMPWHVEHHMGPNQNLNWCVTKPWFDHIMGTSTYKDAKKSEPRHRAEARYFQ